MYASTNHFTNEPLHTLLTPHENPYPLGGMGGQWTQSWGGGREKCGWNVK